MQLDLKSIEARWARLMFDHGKSTRMGLWEKMATLIGNGVPILQALESILEFRKKMFGAKDPVCVAIEKWSVGLCSGMKFSAAIEGWVPDSERMLLAAGEESGRLDHSLRSAVTMLQAGSAIRSAVIGGLAYPVALILLGFGVMYLFGFKIIPSFDQVVGSGKWHGIAAAMVSVSGLIKDWLWLVGIIVPVLVAAFFWSLKRWNGRYRVILDRYPPYNIYRIVQGSTWLIAFSSMNEAGVKIERALEQMSVSSPPWLKTRILACLQGVRGGQSLGHALANSGYEFPDPEIIGDLEVYSRLSGFSDALSLLGNSWLQEGVKRIKTRMTVVFSINLIIVAILIAFMIGGMIAMQLQMTQILSQSLQ